MNHPLIYIQASPPRWRHISHLLQRSTVDCRRRLYQIAFDIDLSSTQDVWFEGDLLPSLVFYFPTQNTHHQS